MTNYKKRTQSLMDEISENLKRTIKKYNEIDQENDLSVIDSVEYENTSNKSKIQEVQQSKKFENESTEKLNIVSNTKKVFDHGSKFNHNSNSSGNLQVEIKEFPNITSHSKNFSGGNELNQNIKNSNNFSNTQLDYSPRLNFKKNNPGLMTKTQKIMDDLEQFNSMINKDFLEVEDMIENMIEKELKNFYR
jgi:hypothetical protein